MQLSGASVTPSAIRIFLLLELPRSPGLPRASLPSTFQELFGGQTLDLLKLTRYHTTRGTIGELHSKKYVVYLGVAHIAFD